MPTRVGDLDLRVVGYEVPQALDAPGGEELGALLSALDLETHDVTLVIAVDPAGRLAIGRWSLPGNDASRIRAAWLEAAGSGWSDAEVGELDALRGTGPDGSTAWAVAMDEVLVYVVTDEPSLAEAALRMTR